MSTQAATSARTGSPAFAEQAQQRLQALLARSATDPTFRAKLLTDSRAALAEFSGTSVSAFENVNIAFVENRADATIVLPEPVDPKTELSDADLEAVAGGATPVVVATVVLAAELIGVAAMAICSD